VATENNPMGAYASYPYGGSAIAKTQGLPRSEEGLLDQNLMMLPTPPSV